jgi:adenine-specific DNA-methyltransferase
LAKGEIQSIRGKDGKWTVHSKQYLRDESGTIRQTKVFSIIEDVYTQHGTGEILDHFGDAHVFPFPKPTKLLKTFLQLCCAEQDSESQIIVDLFAGSGSTAQSILSLNREDQSNRRFIMVQIPEPTMRDDFSTIADIGKERIRRVIAKMKSERAGELDLQTRETPEDLGFRVFKLEESHFRRWTGTAEKDPGELAEQMELFNDPLLPGWTPEDVLWEITLKEGLSLTSRIEPVVPAISAAKPRRDAKSALNTVWRITDDDKNQSLLVCLDDKLNPETFRALDLDRETRFICRNAALTDELAANLALQCRLKTI